MSEETAPVAVAPAAEPTPQATPPATPPPTPTPAPQEKLSKKLFDLLTAPTEDVTEPKKPEKKTEPAPAAKDTAQKEPAAEKPIKVRKPKVAEETPPPVPSKRDLKPTPEPVAASLVTTKPAVDDDAALENDLVDEEKALLEDARAAEKYLGDKYKGHAGKMTTFLRENVKKSEALEKGDIDQSEYDDWYKANLPKIGALDFRKIERERVKEDVTKEFEPKLEAERHSRWVESEAPKIRAKGDAVYQKLINTALPDEVAAAIKERTKGITDRTEYMKAVQSVEKDYALETEITQNIVNAATNDIEEFHRLTTVNPQTGKPLSKMDEANPSQQHQRILQIISDVCADFKANGGAALKKDGKWFVTRQEWADMAPEQRAPFWSFTNDEIAERALGNVKNAVSSAVATERDRLEKRYGFKRTVAQAAAPTPPAPQPNHGAPPAPRPSPVPPPPGTAAPSTGSILAAKLTTNPTEG